MNYQKNYSNLIFILNLFDIDDRHKDINDLLKNMDSFSFNIYKLDFNAQTNWVHHSKSGDEYSDDENNTKQTYSNLNPKKLYKKKKTLLRNFGNESLELDEIRGFLLCFG